jgi:hypothetical protein
MGLTVATDSLLDDQLRLVDALSGVKAALTPILLPGYTGSLEEGVMVMRVSPGAGGAVTVTGISSYISIPPLAVAVMVAVPAATAVTVMVEPELELMDATEALLVDQVTPLSVAVDGRTVALMVKVLPV